MRRLTPLICFCLIITPFNASFASRLGFDQILVLNAEKSPKEIAAISHSLNLDLHLINSFMQCKDRRNPGDILLSFEDVLEWCDHLNAWNIIVESGWKHALILHHTFDMDQSIQKAMDEVWPFLNTSGDGWDIMYLGHCAEPKLHQVYSFLYKSVAPHCLHGYAVTAKAALRLFHYFEQGTMTRPLGMKVRELILKDEFRAFSAHPALIGTTVQTSHTGNVINSPYLLSFVRSLWHTRTGSPAEVASPVHGNRNRVYIKSIHGKMFCMRQGEIIATNDCDIDDLILTVIHREDPCALIKLASDTYLKATPDATLEKSYREGKYQRFSFEVRQDGRVSFRDQFGRFVCDVNGQLQPKYDCSTEHRWFVEKSGLFQDLEVVMKHNRKVSFANRHGYVSVRPEKGEAFVQNVCLDWELFEIVPHKELVNGKQVFCFKSKHNTYLRAPAGGEKIVSEDHCLGDEQFEIIPMNAEDVQELRGGDSKTKQHDSTPQTKVVPPPTTALNIQLMVKFIESFLRSHEIRSILDLGCSDWFLPEIAPRYHLESFICINQNVESSLKAFKKIEIPQMAIISGNIFQFDVADTFSDTLDLVFVDVDVEMTSRTSFYDLRRQLRQGRHALILRKFPSFKNNNDHHGQNKRNESPIEHYYDVGFRQIGVFLDEENGMLSLLHLDNTLPNRKNVCRLRSDEMLLPGFTEL